ncbi:MAG: sugar ABC transporter ATP-binding protein [Candidatus Aminicenantes bacterium]|nr:sugar ABC transporter ATP-binding protein [Candidatus Aminicenantes bacterium]
MQESPLRLKMTGISKHFGATAAVDDVDFELKSGEVHALLGENGAGKSTLVKILSGAVNPDKGNIYLDGEAFQPANPFESRRKGISMIYQELNLAPHLTVLENVMLGREISSSGFLKLKEMADKVQEALCFVGHERIPLDTKVGNLSVGARQIVEITRALIGEANIIIMDEPTSSLSLEDCERLFEIILKLKHKGVGIIYISHFLEEVQRVADRYTVLRDGRMISSGAMHEVSLDEIIHLMVGQEFTELFPRVDHRIEEVVLAVEGLKGKNMLEPIDLELRKGEILGVAGLIGAGRTEMLRTLFGLDKIEKGVIIISGKKVSQGNPRERIKQGVGFLSEDRQAEGLALSLSLADNLTMSRYGPYIRHGFIDLKKQEKETSRFLDLMNIKADNPDQAVDNLSGGNQQKVALARLLHQEAEILLLDEPTRGIDVVSKSQIYEWIGSLSAHGKSIIFVSSYLPELLGVCDNIAVFHRFRLVALRPVQEWDAHSIMTAAALGS